MKPVVPKIRVGDVLHGTKNLRSYLRTASLLRYFELLNQRHSHKNTAKELLYTPRKDDMFVVSANVHGRFCVWSPNKQVILLFANPVETTGPGRPRMMMDPHIFAQWFTRTRERWPDVTSWPRFAHYLWGSLQMNACINKATTLPFHYMPMPHNSRPWDAPFTIIGYISKDTDVATIKHAVKESVIQGNFRNEGKQAMCLAGGRGMGPDLGMLPRMRVDLRHLMRDPRVMARARKDKEVDFQFLMNVQQNPL